MKQEKVKNLVINSISEKTRYFELKLSKILNTQNLNGKINGIPFSSSLTYDEYLKNSHNYIDLNLIIQTLRAYFNETFKWSGLKQKEMRKLESILFFQGKAAIIKLPDGELYISDYSCNNGIYDNYDYPKTIEIIDKYNDTMNGKTIKKDFAVIFNHISKIGLPLLVWNRLLAYLDALKRVDIVNHTSDNKILVSGNADDIAFAELNQLWYSEQPFLKINEDTLLNSRMEQISVGETAKIKQELLLFHLNLILTFLGLKTGDLVEKAERQTEMEIANNDKFNGNLLKNMLAMRIEGSEEIKEKLDLNITPIEPEIIKQEKLAEKEEEKTTLNGEENKKEIGERNGMK